MITVIAISAGVCLLMFLSILIKPYIKIKKITVGLYWLMPLAGAAILIIFGFLSPKEVFENLTADSAVNPIKILVLFISVAVLSVFLDEAGFFRYLAAKVLNKDCKNQFGLFFRLYLTVSVLTVFTSNDIIILTFTPFICYFCKNARLNPVPYLFGEFAAANTWSMALVIGNPTNIYLTQSCGLDFFDYFKTMALPTLTSGAVSLLLLLLIFARQLKQPIVRTEISAPQINDKFLLAAGLAHMSLCTVLLAVSSYIGLDMWYICLFFAVSLFVTVLIYCAAAKKKPNELLKSVKRAPWELIPFVLSMFVIILALSKYGITEKIAGILGNGAEIFSYGAASFFASNIINNIPMSVLFASVLTGSNAGTGAIYAAVTGSNIGAFLTPIGALAGIMWLKILKENDVNFGFKKFIGYGAAVSVPALFAALGVLYLII